MVRKIKMLKLTQGMNLTLNMMWTVILRIKTKKMKRKVPDNEIIEIAILNVTHIVLNVARV